MFMNWKAQKGVSSKFSPTELWIPCNSNQHWRNQQTNPKIDMERPSSRIAKTILKEKDKVGRLILPHFEAYHKSTVIKTAWYYKVVDINEVESRNRTVCTCPLIFNKSAMAIQWGKDSCFNKWCC